VKVNTRHTDSPRIVFSVVGSKLCTYGAQPHPYHVPLSPGEKYRFKILAAYLAMRA